MVITVFGSLTGETDVFDPTLFLVLFGTVCFGRTLLDVWMPAPCAGCSPASFS